MKYIDMENWERKNHYNYFKTVDYPHFSICANLDITTFYNYIKKENLPFFLSFLYLSTKTANEIVEFRLRIRQEGVVEHEVVSPSFTVMTNKGVFSFCTAEYLENFREFISNASYRINEIRDCVCVEDVPEKDDLLFVTSIPWVSFTNITHPIHINPVDSIPRISWGKYFEENGRMKLPLSIQAHHGLVDGIHIGEYFKKIQDMIDMPEKMFR